MTLEILADLLAALFVFLIGVAGFAIGQIVAWKEFKKMTSEYFKAIKKENKDVRI